jgi:hypothetical protein
MKWDRESGNRANNKAAQALKGISPEGNRKKPKPCAPSESCLQNLLNPVSEPGKSHFIPPHSERYLELGKRASADAGSRSSRHRDRLKSLPGNADICSPRRGENDLAELGGTMRNEVERLSESGPEGRTFQAPGQTSLSTLRSASFRIVPPGSARSILPRGASPIGHRPPAANSVFFEHGCHAIDCICRVSTTP